MDWDGALGYMRAAKHAMKNGAVAIQIHGQIGEADEYVVVSPMWCGKITPAIRKLLDEVPKEKVHLIVSSGGMNLKERDGYMSVLDIMKSKHNEDQLIEEFVGSLSA